MGLTLVRYSLECLFVYAQYTYYFISIVYVFNSQKGDGGAPLVCPDPYQKPGENRYIQIGIVSWGIGCSAKIPAVYTNVATVRQWIDDMMQFIALNKSTYISPNGN